MNMFLLYIYKYSEDHSDEYFPSLHLKYFEEHSGEYISLSHLLDADEPFCVYASNEQLLFEQTPRGYKFPASHILQLPIEHE